MWNFDAWYHCVFSSFLLILWNIFILCKKNTIYIHEDSPFLCKDLPSNFYLLLSRKFMLQKLKESKPKIAINDELLGGFYFSEWSLMFTLNFIHTTFHFNWLVMINKIVFQFINEVDLCLVNMNIIIALNWITKTWLMIIL